MLKDDIMIWIILLVTLVIFAGAIVMKVSVWNECRVDHSWFYCMQLMSN